MLDLDDLREIENFDISEDHDLKPINLMRKGLKFRKDLNSVYGSFPNPKWYLIYDALQSIGPGQVGDRTHKAKNRSPKRRLRFIYDVTTLPYSDK